MLDWMKWVVCRFCNQQLWVFRQASGYRRSFNRRAYQIHCEAHH